MNGSLLMSESERDKTRKQHFLFSIVVDFLVFHISHYFGQIGNFMQWCSQDECLKLLTVNPEFNGIYLYCVCIHNLLFNKKSWQAP